MCLCLYYMFDVVRMPPRERVAWNPCSDTILALKMIMSTLDNVQHIIDEVWCSSDYLRAKTQTLTNETYLRMFDVFLTVEESFCSPYQ